MAKQQLSLKYIYKIHSSRLRRNKWNLKLSFQEAKKNQEVISLAESSVMRFIRDINNYNYSEHDVKETKKEINKIKKLPNSVNNKNKIKELYNKLNNILFVEDYICIIMDSIKDFNRCNLKKGFFINGVKYIRLLGTTGGIKNSTIVYVSEKVYEELNKRIENNRNINVELVPAKLEAYKALACSASIPVSMPKGVLVIKDGETNFNTNIIKINDTKEGYPKLTHEKDYPVNFNFADGCAMLLPILSKRWSKELGEDYISSGFNIRNSWCKGMVFTFDFLDFAENVAHSYIVKDAWGNEQDIRNVELILTTNMLKLWNCYNSVEHYLQSCAGNGYEFSIAKICPENLENERNMNYQFLQSYNLSEEDIDKLITPTIEEIKDVLENDYRKTILFARGIHLTDENATVGDYDYIKALMIEPKMIEDPFVKHRIYSLIEKRIKDAKIGVIKVSGNYSIVAGDIYALCQYMFGMKVAGLLKANEFYSKTWIDKGVNKVVAYRAPMTCHNNIRILNVVDSEEIKHWYKYITTCTVLNAWDTTTHAMNGEDFDSDAIITTDNEVLLRNTQNTDAILCVQKSAIKCIVSEDSLIKSNKDGFGDEIGTTTNRITGMFEVLSKFNKDTPEYKELMYRIMCGQHYQQTAIDKIKGIISNSMPKEWYEYKVNKINENDDKEVIKKKEFNLSILADKKPYFFIHIYSNIMSLYKKYLKDTDNNCLMRFGLTVEELQQKQDKSKDEETYLDYYHKMMPVGTNPCLLNRICWRIEKEFDGFLKKINYEDFDYDILKSNVEYSQEDYSFVKKIYEEYNRAIRQYSQTIKKEKVEKEERQMRRQLFKDTFKEKAYEICNNEDELCNIVIDLCYKSNTSKQFAWDIVGETIIKNLLIRNNYKIHYPELDENGDIEFNGYKFSMQEKMVESEDDID
jgi:hypothetical protein